MKSRFFQLFKINWRIVRRKLSVSNPILDLDAWMQCRSLLVQLREQYLGLLGQGVCSIDIARGERFSSLL